MCSQPWYVHLHRGDNNEKLSRKQKLTEDPLVDLQECVSISSLSPANLSLSPMRKPCFGFGSLQRTVSHTFIVHCYRRDPLRQRQLASRASTCHRSGNSASIANATLSTLGGSFLHSIVLCFQPLALLQSDADGPANFAVTPQFSLTQYTKFALLRMH